MERRNFICSGLGALATIPLVSSPINSFLGWKSLFREGFPLCGISPQSVKLNLKPIMTNMIHSGIWEGPCRNNVVTVEEETSQVNESFKAWSKSIRSEQSVFSNKNINLLTPSMVIFNEDFKLYPDQFEKIEADALKADALLISPDANRMLLLKGKLVGSWGYNEDLLSCSVSAFIVGQDSGNAKQFIEKQIDYGNRLVWVYGDYTEEFKKLSEMLKIEIEIIS